MTYETFKKTLTEGTDVPVKDVRNFTIRVLVCVVATIACAWYIITKLMLPIFFVLMIAILVILATMSLFTLMSDAEIFKRSHKKSRVVYILLAVYIALVVVFTIF